MNFSVTTVEQLTPIFIAALALIPFVSVFNKKTEKPKLESSSWPIIYLIVLVIAACAFVLLEGIQLMCVDNGDRSLFICAMLVIACIDQMLNLLPLRKTLQFDLATLLTYSIVLLCSIPLLWQILRHTVPQELSNRANIMHPTEFLLILVVVVLYIGNGFVNRIKDSKTD